MSNYSGSNVTYLSYSNTSVTLNCYTTNNNQKFQLCQRLFTFNLFYYNQAAQLYENAITYIQKPVMSNDTNTIYSSIAQGTFIWSNKDVLIEPDSCPVPEGNFFYNAKRLKKVFIKFSIF